MAIQLKNWTLPLAIAALCAVGCNSKTDTASGDAGAESSEIAGEGAAPSNMAGTIKINGSSTVLPISNAVAEKFAQQYPDVSVSVDGAGTGNGFKDFEVKKTDISDASRPIKPGEKEKCQANEVAFIEVPVAYDGLTIVINPKNDWVKSLTIDQLKKIFVGDDAAKTWKDVDPSWPEEKIDIYAPGTGSGTYDYFHEVVVGKSDAELRQDMSLNEDDNILVKGVADNKNAIGFFGVAYYEESKDKLTAVQIINPKDGKAYLPTTENIASGNYAPFSRPLFIYVSLASLKRAEVQTFVSYYMDNVSELCERVGYVRLPESIIEKGKANIENRAAGTHYINAEGETRSGALEDIFVEENLVK
ncbi:PstS family phosphate ABC transporter substrate-binding protein [Stieleria sp. JC731]|uniref:PstS family phosphate ABC transporter substrate-binding protein n=1 Tax=Pirellulaceae TaxID=2691357 RepID=UPI001E2D7D67|nr:PstS family phosphate ABC transporter substrate-binding protein [Stieleria sp. JC731]MCC9602131.1 PstS family phosphate ABC transporter substrate-binding protein [Stieleria sp. JC731]